jgi:hypothetical protein
MTRRWVSPSDEPEHDVTRAGGKPGREGDVVRCTRRVKPTGARAVQRRIAIGTDRDRSSFGATPHDLAFRTVSALRGAAGVPSGGSRGAARPERGARACGPGVGPAQGEQLLVDGTVFAITAAELAAADDYEVDDYARVLVPLRSGRRAWVYALAGGSAAAGSSDG